MTFGLWVSEALQPGLVLALCGFGVVVIINTVLAGVWAGRISEKVTTLQGQVNGMWQVISALSCRTCDLSERR